jgi:hypothetical protein
MNLKAWLGGGKICSVGNGREGSPKGYFLIQEYWLLLVWPLDAFALRIVMRAFH